MLDTNVLIPSLISGQPESRWLKRVLMRKPMIFCAIVITEFLVKATAKEKRVLQTLIDYWGVVAIDQAVCETAANYRKKLLVKSKPPYLLDCLIAACAKSANATLYTYNTADYPMKDIQIATPPIRR